MSVLSSTLAELKRLGVVDSVEGQLAIAAAGMVDDRAGVQNISSTMKQLREVMQGLRDSAPRQGDVVDELLAKRAATRRPDTEGVQRTTKRRVNHSR